MNFTKISRELIKSMTFRPFDQNDYYAFCDVQSPIPLIGESESEGILMVIDGDYAELYAYDAEFSFDCIDQCESIRELPIKTEKQIRIEAEIQAMEKSLAALKAELK
jgi:hypothetical protein